MPTHAASPASRPATRPIDLSGASYVARPAIGILTGSGPEAGIDLWAKILHENRRRLGAAFRGDIDAPAVTVISDPALGLSMEPEKNEARVWAALRAGVLALDGKVAAFAIACNTLNLFADRIAALELRSEFVSFADVLGRHLRERGAPQVCLLGARPVMELGAWSPYRGLAGEMAFERLDAAGTRELHQLIYDIKQHGAARDGLRARLAALLARIASPTVLLACTELPLIADPPTSKQLVDVTQLVAEALVERTGVRAAPGAAPRPAR